MTSEEFSNSLDTLLNSYNIQAGFGEGASKQGGITLDEYEKSVLLTQAQDNITKSYFTRTTNSNGEGFDDSTRRQIDFSSLITIAHYKRNVATGVLVHNDEKCFDDRGLAVNLPYENTKILFILNERLKVTDPETQSSDVYVIVPINYKEYDREMSKAYAQPLKKQAWRMFSNTLTGYDVQSEIIPIYGTIKDTDDVTYDIRYVKRPKPIVLTDLPDGLSIDGESTASNPCCSLNPILHKEIVEEAYRLAIATRGGGTAVQQRNSNRQDQD